jgi:o-succinylbenzoate synthase
MEGSVIERAEISPLSFELSLPLVTSRGAVALRKAYILRLFDRDGASGAGEAAPAYWLGDETLEETAASLKRIAARVRARPIAPDDLRRWAGLAEPRAAQRDDADDQHAPAGMGRDGERGNGAAALWPAARSALDCALLELRAKRAGCAVAELLADSVEGAEPARPVAVSFLLAGESASAIALQARDAARAGFRTFKLKLGAHALADDLARVSAVAAQARGCALRLDANRAFAFDQARELLMRLGAAVADTGASIEFVEEPLADSTPAALARLREATGIRVALDESFDGARSLEPYLATKAVDVIVLKAARLGGPSRCVEIAARGARAGIVSCATDSLEGEMGMAAAVHLGAALPSPAPAVGLGGAHLGAPFPFSHASLQASRIGFCVRAAA